MKFRIIEDQRETFPVRVLCDVMGVPPAGYYAWRSWPEGPREAPIALCWARYGTSIWHIAAAMARRGSMRSCVALGTRRAAAASSAASCAAKA